MGVFSSSSPLAIKQNSEKPKQKPQLILLCLDYLVGEQLRFLCVWSSPLG